MLLKWKRIDPATAAIFSLLLKLLTRKLFNPLCFGVFCSFFSVGCGDSVLREHLLQQHVHLMNNMLKMNFTWQPRGNPGFFHFWGTSLGIHLGWLYLERQLRRDAWPFQGRGIEEWNEWNYIQNLHKSCGLDAVDGWNLDFLGGVFERRFAVNCRGHVLVWAKNMHFLKFRSRVKTSLDSFCLLSLGDNQPAPIQLTQMLPFNAAVLMAMEVCGISVSWNLSMEMACGWFSYLATPFTTSDW